jgi:hypothetical protein
MAAATLRAAGSTYRLMAREKLRQAAAMARQTARRKIGGEPGFHRLSINVTWTSLHLKLGRAKRPWHADGIGRLDDRRAPWRWRYQRRQSSDGSMDGANGTSIWGSWERKLYRLKTAGIAGGQTRRSAITGKSSVANVAAHACAAEEEKIGFKLAASCIKATCEGKIMAERSTYVKRAGIWKNIGVCMKI